MTIRQHKGEHTQCVLLPVFSANTAVMWTAVRGAGAAADLRVRQRVHSAVERRLGESVPTSVNWLFFGHQSLGPFDDFTHAVNEAFLLRWQDEFTVHLDDKRWTKYSLYSIILVHLNLHL